RRDQERLRRPPEGGPTLRAQAHPRGARRPDVHAARAAPRDVRRDGRHRVRRRRRPADHDPGRREHPPRERRQRRDRRDRGEDHGIHAARHPVPAPRAGARARDRGPAPDRGRRRGRLGHEPRLPDAPELRHLGRPDAPSRTAALPRAPGAPLAARRVGALRLERLPRLAVVPDDRPPAHPRVRADPVGRALRRASRGGHAGGDAGTRATAGHGVSGPAGAGGAAARTAAGSRPIASSRLRALVVSARPAQWTKNGALLVAPLFAQQLSRPDELRPVVLGVAAFSALASAVYLANDVVDRERDRLHPDKRHRPIAAGALSPQLAIGASAALGVVGLGVAAAVGSSFFLVTLAYLALQALYTTILKHLVVVDVFAVASGFVLRVVAGAEAAAVPISNWLYLCTLLLSLFLAL